MADVPEQMAGAACVYEYDAKYPDLPLKDGWTTLLDPKGVFHFMKPCELVLKVGKHKFVKIIVE